MLISTITLYNWKNFQHCEAHLADRCFIVGANATGKSNLLDAIRFLHDVVKQGGGLQTAVDDRGGITRIRCLSARKRTDVEIGVELKESVSGEIKWKYVLGFRHTGGGIRKSQVSIVTEQVYSAEAGGYVLNRSAESEGEDEETLKYTHLEQANANQKFREVKDFFLQVEYLNIIPQLIRESDGRQGGKDDYYGRGFLARLSVLNEATRNSYLKKINEVVRLAVPQLSELSFAKDENNMPHLEARYLHWRAQGSKQRETQFSDGTLRLIGFLFALLDGNGVVLLEEPEINLHPGIVAHIPEFIARMQRYKNRQVLITTHSYDILSDAGIDENEVLLLTATDEGTQVTNISNEEDICNVLGAGFSVADALIPRTKPDGIDELGTINLAVE